MPIDIQTLPANSINTKWKDPYASASLNRRPVGITPAGIYRGLIISEDPSLGDRTVLLVADPDKGDHVAVFETEDGFSINYRDGSSGDIVLSLTSYLAVDVLVCLVIEYQIGSATTGKFRTYTQAEFNGLSVSFKDTLVVMGTVTVPGTTSTPIPGSSINLNGRTLASSNIQKGLVQSAPITRNPSFEIGEVGTTDRWSSNYWEKSSSGGTGSWNTSSVKAQAGTKSIQLSISSGPFTGVIEQQCGIETVFGGLFPCEIAIWQEKTVSSGLITFFVRWFDSTGAFLSESTQSLDGGVDAGWRVINPIFSAPSGAVVVGSFGVRATALSPSTTGVFAYIDTINVFMEPPDPQLPYAFDQRFRHRINASSIELMDKDSDFSDKTASISYDPALPAGEGTLSVDPTNASDLPPALNLPGRMIELGSQLLATGVNALKARISADPAASGVSIYTLMWESKISGLKGSRRYVKWDGTLVNTGNARWDGASWNKDVGGDEASRTDLGTDGLSRILVQEAGTDVWGDGAWTTTNLLIAGNGDITAAGDITATGDIGGANLDVTGGNIDTATLAATGLITTATLTSTGLITAATLTSTGLITANAGLTAAANQDITISGTGEYKHGNMQMPIPPSSLVSLWSEVSNEQTTVGGVPNVRGNAAVTALARYGHVPVPLPVGSHVRQVLAYFDRGGTSGYLAMLVGTKTISSDANSLTQYNTASGTGSATASTGTIDIAITSTVALYVRIHFGFAGNVADAEFRGLLVTYDHP